MFNNEANLLKKENDNNTRWMAEDDEDIIDKIMESIGIFRVNSFDTQVIRRDLIGMAEEARLRDSNMKEVIGDDINLTTYDIIKNSRGCSKAEIVLLYLKYLSGIVFVMLGSFGSIINQSFIWDVNTLGLFSFSLSITMFFFMAKLIRPLLNMEGWGRFGYYLTLFQALSLATPATYSITTYFFGHIDMRVSGVYVLLVSGIAYLIAAYFYKKNINKLAIDKIDYFDGLTD